MFFELRRYRIKDGKRDQWVQFMEDEIIPFQISKGMVICGSFIDQENPEVYVWIRRFEDEADKERLYAAVYESDQWKNNLSPRVGEILDRETIQVTRLEATPKSVIQ